MSTFPSLVVAREGLEPRGAFAESQAAWLRPQPRAVADLSRLCEEKRVGVVAHFYMDAELQGVLSSSDWAHIDIADSLKMADAAVGMAEAGMKTIVVLGVDFMSENVRAVLDAAGHTDVVVLRVATDPIGCSLAESADAPAYAAFLEDAARHERALHVVYINTSLVTKARSHHAVPTITCTSSNVIQTVLQAAAQVPGIQVFYGPDTYMGHNLEVMLHRYAAMSDDEVRALHPDHDAASVRSLIDRFHYFRQGACIVHHLFGADVVDRGREEHADAFHTAHLEVPGEMFQLAVEAQDQGRGVVGSTSDILGFILARLDEALAADGPAHLPFVLGTEAGMITAIVKGVRAALVASGRDDVAVEIIFPVASEAVAEAPESGLGIIPGVAGGEGCSTAGGCATCPFMKMNDLDALFEVLDAVGTGADLTPYEPRKYTETVGGQTAAELGCEPILHMRHFQRHGGLSPALVANVLSR